MTTTLREAEIRPDHLMKEQAERFARDVAYLLNYRSRFVEVPCPACNAQKPIRAFEKYTLDYQNCTECGTVYLSPRPPPDVLRLFYAHSENYQYWNSHIFPASEQARRTKIFAPRAQRLAELCAKYQVQGGTLMEVGAGFGTFCEEVRNRNLFERILAVEPTPDLAATCRKRGLEVLSERIEDVDLGGTLVDVVASFEVLEHLFDPAAFLKACLRQLRPAGLIFLTCPNILGFDVLVLGTRSATIDVEHLNYFHPRSLSLLARRTGFEVLESLTPGELDAELVRKKVLAGEIDLASQEFLKQVLIDEWERVGGLFQAFLKQAGLSSHQWLVARKPAR